MPIRRKHKKDLSPSISLTGTWGAHQDEAHLLSNGLGLVGSIGDTFFQVLHSSFQLSDDVLQA